MQAEATWWQPGLPSPVWLPTLTAVCAREKLWSFGFSVTLPLSRRHFQLWSRRKWEVSRQRGTRGISAQEQNRSHMVDKCLGVGTSLPLQVLWGTAPPLSQGSSDRKLPFFPPLACGVQQGHCITGHKTLLHCAELLQTWQGICVWEPTRHSVTKNKPHIPKCLHYPQKSTTAKAKGSNSKSRSTFGVNLWCGLSVISGD